jgi:phosphate uptake regulator
LDDFSRRGRSRAAINEQQTARTTMVIPKHILGTFDEALSSLRNDVLMMAGLAERSLDRALKGLFQRNDDLCTHAIADDEEIDQFEKQIDKDGVEFCFAFSRWRRICGG